MQSAILTSRQLYVLLVQNVSLTYHPLDYSNAASRGDRK